MNSITSQAEEEGAYCMGFAATVNARKFLEVKSDYFSF